MCARPRRRRASLPSGRSGGRWWPVRAPPTAAAAPEVSARSAQAGPAAAPAGGGVAPFLCGRSVSVCETGRRRGSVRPARGSSALATWSWPTPPPSPPRSSQVSPPRALCRPRVAAVPVRSQPYCLRDDTLCDLSRGACHVLCRVARRGTLALRSVPVRCAAVAAPVGRRAPLAAGQVSCRCRRLPSGPTDGRRCGRPAGAKPCPSDRPQ